MDITPGTRSPLDTMTAYFDAWRARDADAVRPLLTEDVVFDGPMGHVDGPDDNVAGLRGLFSVVAGLDVLTTVADGDDVITVYLLHTSIADEPVTTVNWSHVTDGRIDAIRAVFDPRPLL